MAYHYIQSEPGLWTVGVGDPKQKTWEPESDWPTSEAAAARVRFLNGGTEPGQTTDTNKIAKALLAVKREYDSSRYNLTVEEPPLTLGTIQLVREALSELEGKWK